MMALRQKGFVKLRGPDMRGYHFPAERVLGKLLLSRGTTLGETRPVCVWIVTQMRS